MAAQYCIMIVEDSETQRLNLSYLLEQNGWVVIPTASSEDALEELSHSLPDLLVVDYHLPGMYGDELCRQLRLNVDTRSIPILMLTATEAEDAEMRGLDSGADDYLPKAAEDEILLLHIESLLRRSQAQAAIAQPGDDVLRRARLLAVDDSPTFRESLVEELRHEGYSIEQAASGEEALRRVDAAPFDCVLLDLMMPDMDGTEVCRRLVERRAVMDDPIVVLMLTASEDRDDMARGLAAGADDFVSKSSDMSVIKARIRALLRRKFFQADNRRILDELKAKELEAVRARAKSEAAEGRAALADELQRTNHELEESHRRLQAAQSHLVQSEKMASLGQLVAGIAHEINNPLAFVTNNVYTIGRALEQVAEAAGPLLPADVVGKIDKAMARLDESRQGLDRVEELVTKLRTFSRLDEGEFKTVDIHESIDSVLLFLRHRMKDRIEVVKEYGPNGLLSCYGGQLNQVIMNVAANAVDAIEGEGTITISTAATNGTCRIAIRDTGKGIPEAITGRVFDPFFTTKEVGKGTGLGLSISYGIVEAHRGSLECHSREGEGTEFVISIPTDLKGDSES